MEVKTSHLMGSADRVDCSHRRSSLCETKNALPSEDDSADRAK